MGMKSSDTAELQFEDVRVPQSYRIGEEGFGFTYQMEQFQEERLFAALKRDFFPDLEVMDEGDYWESRDIARLQQRTGRRPEEIRTFMERTSPQGRLMTAEEVADAALFLCGETARGITGQSILIDGGRWMI